MEMATNLQPVTNRTRQEWVEVIASDWRESIESIIETGRDLVAAKLEIPRGEFIEMVKEDLPFSPRTAQNLMKIANHPEIGKTSEPALLPPSWAVLSELSNLSPEDFQNAKELELISSTTTHATARAVAKAHNIPEGEVVGEGLARHTLPSPQDARDIAEKMGRAVEARDGKIYFGASQQEQASNDAHREQTYQIKDAIHAIASLNKSPGQWWEQAQDWQVADLRLADLDAAASWLERLQIVVKSKTNVIDHGE